eukprot:TRINITY_DN13978_c0_g1_i1.p2 TRINITY_DN13978_c0_g1~~TRINITY_DN13978_c0_g1_i1.p2  ORF type:complete len:103 (+),score=16.16 TRINITY_DN13978_c0_g1_i1:51-359(+)
MPNPPPRTPPVVLGGKAVRVRPDGRFAAIRLAVLGPAPDEAEKDRLRRSHVAEVATLRRLGKSSKALRFFHTLDTVDWTPQLCAGVLAAGHEAGHPRDGPGP